MQRSVPPFNSFMYTTYLKTLADREIHNFNYEYSCITLSIRINLHTQYEFSITDIKIIKQSIKKREN